MTGGTGSAAGTAAARRAVEAVWRIEAARIVATLTRFTGDFGLAEDVAQEALAAALTQWPQEGVPRNPGAWLTTTARRRAVDAFRRRERLDARLPQLATEAEQVDQGWDPDTIDDDACCG